MSQLINKYAVVATVLAVLAIFAFVALHASCHSGAYSVCLLTICAFALTSTALFVPLTVVPFTTRMPLNRGAAIPFRLERPPRT